MRNWFVLLFAIAVSALGGCSTTTDNQLPRVELVAAATPADAGPVLSYSITAWKDAEGTRPASEAVVNQVKLELLEVLQLSNRFSRIVRNDPNADISLQIVYREYSTPGARASAFVTAASLALIPSKETVYIDISATAEAANGAAQTYELADSATQKRGLPAASESAAAESLAAKPEIRKNIFRTVVNRMVEDGLIAVR